MNKQLSDKAYILGDDTSLSNVSLYAYTQNADKGGLDLSPYRNLHHWLERIERLPNFVKL